jgi:hypothetical protein
LLRDVGLAKGFASFGSGSKELRGGHPAGAFLLRTLVVDAEETLSEGEPAGDLGMGGLARAWVGSDHRVAESRDEIGISRLEDRRVGGARLRHPVTPFVVPAGGGCAESFPDDLLLLPGEGRREAGNSIAGGGVRLFLVLQGSGREQGGGRACLEDEEAVVREALIEPADRE